MKRREFISLFAALINTEKFGHCRDNGQGREGGGIGHGWQVDRVKASTNREIEVAFATIKEKRADALLVAPDRLMADRRVQIATPAVRDAIPLIASQRDYSEAGENDELWNKLVDTYRQTGIYTGRILKGENPADLPVLRATKFEFVINLQTARTIRLEIPPTLLALADEVIE